MRTKCVATAPGMPSRHVPLTPQETAEHDAMEAAWRDQGGRPLETPTETQILRRALKAKGIDITDADLEAARTACPPIA